MSVTGGSERFREDDWFSAPDSVPAASDNTALRLSLAPDGKSVTYSIARTSNLLRMDGLKSVTGR